MRPMPPMLQDTLFLTLDWFTGTLTKEVRNKEPNVAMGITIHLDPVSFRRVFAAVKAMTTADPIEVSHEDYKNNVQRFKFRGVIYEAVEPETTKPVLKKDFLL